METKATDISYELINLNFINWLKANKKQLYPLSGPEFKEAIKRRWIKLSLAYINYLMAKGDLEYLTVKSTSYPESEE